MNQPLRLGIAGLGTVGAGVVKIIQSKSELLRMRTGPLRGQRDPEVSYQPLPEINAHPH